MNNFRHFETLAKARAYLKTLHRLDAERLQIRKKRGKHKKPYTVGTPLAHLHFTKDSWV